MSAFENLPVVSRMGCFRNTSRPPEPFTPHTYFAFLNRVCQVMQRWLFTLLYSRRLQDSVVDGSPFYLANFFVLRQADA